MPKTLDRATTAVSTFDRKQEILDAVDNLISVHDAWENDPKAPDVPSEALEEAILAAIEICEHGDVPAQCRELVTAMKRFHFEWDAYATDEYSRSDGTPSARFWASLAAVLDARNGANPFVPKRPEPVDELLKQGVSYQQIGLHIYGHRGKGPFIREDGLIDIPLIKREAETPGSVITDDWIHPAETARQRQWENSIEYQLTAIKRREENEPESAIDKASIEDLLTQGASAQVVANVKKVTVDEVLAVQRRIQQAEEKNSELPDESREQADESSKPDFDAVSFIMDRLAANQGIPEIVAGLKENGVRLSSKEVREIIENQKKPDAAA